MSTIVSAGQVVSVLSDPDNPNFPDNARLDSCFAHEFTPAIIETVTEKTPLTPARLAVDLETGKTTVIKEATFHTVVIRKVVQKRKEMWFETICPQFYTERFVKSLQRALKARGFYSGVLTGWLDDQTNLAVKLYQRKDGTDSTILALRTAEEFGLISHRVFEKSKK